MLGRTVLALSFTLPLFVLAAGVAEAAKGPDATEVGLGTFLVVLGGMAFLGMVALIKAALGGMRLPPPEEPTTTDHH